MIILRCLLALFLLCSIQACAPGGGSRQLTPVQEAFRLMDKGDNAKAVLVLEQELKSHPENDEARALLGSAYVGLAGVDVYAIQEAFHDILFKRSLISEFEGKGGGAPAVPARAPVVDPANPDSAVNEVERSLQRVDRAIIDVQKIAMYLSRFPQVPKEKWVYLEKALHELKDFKSTSDLPLYRVLIRLIYVKSYLVEEVIRDDGFGTNQWACNVQTDSLKDGFEFVGEHLRNMRDDMVIAVQNGAKKLAKAEGMFGAIVDATSVAESAVILKNSRTVNEAEAQLRKALGCPYTR